MAPASWSARPRPSGPAPPRRLSETSIELGSALGVALLGSVSVAVYRAQLAGSLAAGLPPAVIADAHGSLGGGAAAARTLPEAAGPALLATAQEAFAAGARLAAVCAAV